VGAGPVDGYLWFTICHPSASSGLMMSATFRGIERFSTFVVSESVWWRWLAVAIFSVPA
jgi:hypothetical protein